MKRVIVVLWFLLSGTPVAQAECDDFASTHVDHLLTKRISNRDGSSLLLKTTECETEVVLEFQGKSGTVIRVSGGSDTSDFTDLNGDGAYEVEISTACGMVNCSNTIYSIDPKSRKARKVLEYSGFNLRKLGEYLIASDRTAGFGEYEHSAYKVTDYSKLVVSEKPSFTVRDYFDPKIEKQVCRISLRQKYRQSEIVQAIVKDVCLPSDIIQMGDGDL